MTRRPDPLNLSGAKLLLSDADRDKIKHYVKEKHFQAASVIYGVSVGMALTSKEFADASAEERDKILDGLSASAWNAAPFLLQQAELLDMVKIEEGQPPPGAN